MAMQDLEKIEAKFDRTAARTIAVSDEAGGIKFQTVEDVYRLALLMSTSGAMVPKHLRENQGACAGIIVQALEWRMSPWSVANKSYYVNDRIAFESQLIHAVIETRAPLKERLRASFEGSGPDRKCIVTGHFRDEVDPVIYTSPAIKDIAVKNSPLWRADPDQQLWYYASRAWARRYCPDILLGIYSRDELEQENDHTGPDRAKDVTPKPRLSERLKGNRGRGFDHAHVERQTTTTITETVAADNPPPASSAAEAGDSPVVVPTATTPEVESPADLFVASEVTDERD